MGDLEGPLSRLQFHDVLRRKVPDASEAFSLPPIGIVVIHDRDLVAGPENPQILAVSSLAVRATHPSNSLEVQLVRTPGFEVVEDDV